MITIIPDDGSAILSLFTISEMHGNSSEVTEHPVEEGTNPADNVRTNPKSLSAEIFISNTPIDVFDPHGSQVQSVDAVFPVFQPPLDFTPGAVFRLAGSAISAALDFMLGPTPPNQLMLRVFPQVFDAVLETQTALNLLIDNAVTCTVLTSTLTYTSMLLTKVSMPRDEPNASAFSIEFKELKTVESQTVSAPTPKNPRGAPSKNNGAQAPKTPDAKHADAVSLAKGILDKALHGAKVQ